MGAKGFTPLYVQARVLDFAPEKDVTIEVPVEENHKAFIFLLLGDGEIEGKAYDEKSAILLGPGDTISFKSLSEGARVIVYAAPKLEEPVAWGGPIVMNSQEELDKAFDEFNDGSFIKHKL